MGSGVFLTPVPLFADGLRRVEAAAGALGRFPKTVLALADDLPAPFEYVVPIQIG